LQRSFIACKNQWPTINGLIQQLAAELPFKFAEQLI